MTLADLAVHREVTVLIDLLVKSRRIRGDLPQQRLATMLGVSTRTVQDWEAAQDAPTVRHLIAWAHLLALRIAVVDGLDRQIRCPLVRERGEEYEVFETRRLAAILRDLREAVPRLTQREVARLAGVSRLSILRWENLETFPRTTGLVRWAHALDCRIRLVPLRPA